MPADPPDRAPDTPDGATRAVAAPAGALCGAVRAHAVGQRLDVGGVGRVVGQQMQFGHMPPFAQCLTHLVRGRRGGGARILREQRQHQDALGAVGTQRGQSLRHIGGGVEHAQLHGHGFAMAIAQAGAQCIAQRNRDGQQR
jgi:hypothetical protein